MTINRNDQLRHIGNNFTLIHKAILTKYSCSVTSVTPVSSKVVGIVGTEPNINIKRIASLLMISSAAATQHVAALEETGILIRNMSPRDRREILVALTQKGEELYQEIQTASLIILNDIFRELSDEDLKSLDALITRVSNKYIGLE